MGHGFGSRERRSQSGLLRSSPAAASKPKLNHDRVDRKSNPEGEPEELAWLQMGNCRCVEEDAHHRTSGGNAKQNSDGAKHPALLALAIAEPGKRPGAVEREEEQGIEKNDGGALHPSSNGVSAHGIGGQSDNDSQEKDGSLKGSGTAGAAPERQRQQHHEGQAAQNVDIREGGVSGKISVERGHLRRRVRTGRCGERKYATDDNGNR